MKTFCHVENPPVFEELNVITEETGRRYQTPAGLWYPSITTVLSLVSEEGISKWKELVGEEYANSVKVRGGKRGNRFHDMTEKYLNNEPIDLKSLNYLEADVFRRAIPTLNKIDNILVQEKPLYSDHLETAGRVDCIGEYEGKFSIIDFKTATKEKDDNHIQHYYMQTAGYAVMFEERTGIPVSNLVLIIATDQGEIYVRKSKRDRHIKDFIHWRGVYRERFGV